ncbi:hypothetical protein V6N11_021221 [Hibiscus sabdariffa]|uniref:Terpene synthase metal-binding domain-containing protein n=1 Tax=Hibiscus sabdariffa TaxID=183260 RepID=A0ABR2NMB8_9ROSI
MIFWKGRSHWRIATTIIAIHLQSAGWESSFNLGLQESNSDYTKVICKVVLVVFDVIAEEARVGEVTRRQAFEWLRIDPYIMKASNVLDRFMDDIVSHKFEQLREHGSSSVDCYMKQHNLSEERTFKDFEYLLEDAWKDVTEEYMRPTVVTNDLLI